MSHPTEKVKTLYVCSPRMVENVSTLTKCRGIKWCGSGYWEGGRHLPGPIMHLLWEPVDCGSTLPSARSPVTWSPPTGGRQHLWPDTCEERRGGG